MVQLTAEGSSGSLTPQTLCSPELKTESHQVSFKLVLWMRQGSVIVSGGQRRHKGGTEETRKTVSELQASICEGRGILSQALSSRNSPRVVLLRDHTCGLHADNLHHQLFSRINNRSSHFCRLKQSSWSPFSLN